VTSSNPNGTAYLSADPFPHQTVRFSTDEHYNERKGYTVHIYTHANGVYDHHRETTWQRLTDYNRFDMQACQRSSDEEARLYSYPGTKGASVKAPSQSAGATTPECYGNDAASDTPGESSVASYSAASYSAVSYSAASYSAASYVGRSKTSKAASSSTSDYDSGTLSGDGQSWSDNGRSNPWDEVGQAANSSTSAYDASTLATADDQSWPDGWYADPWDESGKTLRWFANGSWTGHTQ